jgi:hypothetical protein
MTGDSPALPLSLLSVRKWHKKPQPDTNNTIKERFCTEVIRDQYEQEC